MMQHYNSFKGRRRTESLFIFVRQLFAWPHTEMLFESLSPRPCATIGVRFDAEWQQQRVVWAMNDLAPTILCIH